MMPSMRCSLGDGFVLVIVFARGFIRQNQAACCSPCPTGCKL